MSLHELLRESMKITYQFSFLHTTHSFIASKTYTLLSSTNCTMKMLKIYFPHISEVLPFSLTMVTTMLFDITYYDFP